MLRHRISAVILIFLCLVFLVSCGKRHKELPKYTDELQRTDSDSFRVRYKSHIYCQIEEAGRKRVPIGWSEDARNIQEEDIQEPEALLLEDYQANSSFMIGGRIYYNHASPEIIYVQSAGSLYTFVIEEVLDSWICFQGNLYLDEEAYISHYTGETRVTGYHYWDDSDSAYDVGDCKWFHWLSRYRFPHKELFTNDSTLKGCQVTYDPEQRCLFVTVKKPDSTRVEERRQFYLIRDLEQEISMGELRAWKDTLEREAHVKGSSIYETFCGCFIRDGHLVVVMTDPDRKSDYEELLNHQKFETVVGNYSRFELEAIKEILETVLEKEDHFRDAKISISEIYDRIEVYCSDQTVVLTKWYEEWNRPEIRWFFVDAWHK
ncbi:MAG: hypothetical protein IJU99_00970 [Lachnospiraceae bacterium]|nr:hypothetical protein [Lachnospiraceae bacterium]